MVEQSHIIIHNKGIGHLGHQSVSRETNCLYTKLAYKCCIDWHMIFMQEKANQRKSDLDDSLQAQQYFADANEAESWMREKEPIVCNTDYGKDEDSAEVSILVLLLCTYLSLSSVLFLHFSIYITVNLYNQVICILPENVKYYIY